MNRVPLIVALWFVFWTTTGYFLGRYLEVPGYFTVLGFVSGLVTIFTWPFVLPNRLQEWMDE